MSIGQKDIKLLWGRAAGRCSICGELLSADNMSEEFAYLIGEQAHVVGEKTNAARGKSNIDEEKRNSYHNLILLCPNCHTRVDKNPEDYSVEKLFIIKSEHELKVQETFALLTKDSKEEAVKIVYSSLIDSTVELCDINNWSNWLSELNSYSMGISDDMVENLRSFIIQGLKANYPDEKKALDRSIKTLVYILYDILEVYFLHVTFDSERDKWFGEKFYKTNGNFNINYHNDLEIFEEWVKKVFDLSIEATKALNWIADEVRKELNPLFYAEKGKFSFFTGPYENMKNMLHYPCFTEKEKSDLPNSYIRMDEKELEKYN